MSRYITYIPLVLALLVIVGGAAISGYAIVTLTSDLLTYFGSLDVWLP